MQDARVGLVLDNRYRIESWIASGGTGVVYRGTRIGLDKSVAIKFLHQSGVDSDRGRKRFRREAAAMSRLTHHNLATIIDFGSHEGVPYLVIEFYDGVSLRKELESGALGLERAVRIAQQILAGLASAHEVGVVHRDLKPANVLLTLSLGKDHIKILDFGVAKLVAPEGNIEVSVTAGAPQGTPQYMSPEQARSRQVGPRTDLYAVGILLYEMCTGKRPFDGGAGFAVLRSQVEDTPTPPRELVPTMSRGLERVILTAMAKKPSDRYDSAGHMAAVLAGVPEAGTRRRAATRAGTGRSGRGLRLFLLFTLLIGAAGFAGWYAADNGYIEVPEWFPWQPSS